MRTRPPESGPPRGADLRRPAAIYAESFRLARELSDLSAVPEGLRPLALRLVHACGMPEIARDLAFGGDPLAAGRAALAAGGAVLCDARMVEAGVMRDRLPAGCATYCAIDAPEVRGLAEDLGTTRSAAAVELWRGRLRGAVVAVGNAPTALFHLLERLGTWPERPAAILAFPVGLVGAAESKEALVAAADGGLGVPYATLRGRFGGSALAAAAVNALLLADPAS
jgi:precorrin-8X/cobalt-precorrin-8 methylmutase